MSADPTPDVPGLGEAVAWGVSVPSGMVAFNDPDDAARAADMFGAASGATVVPLYPLPAILDAIRAAEQRGEQRGARDERAAERAAVADWLRGCGRALHALVIERGEHRTDAT